MEKKYYRLWHNQRNVKNYGNKFNNLGKIWKVLKKTDTRSNTKYK